MSGSSLTALEIESTAAFVTVEIASPTMCLLLSVKDDEASPDVAVLSVDASSSPSPLEVAVGDGGSVVVSAAADDSPRKSP